MDEAPIPGSRVRATTKHGALTVDEIAAMQPGMARLMDELSRRYWVLYYAAKAGNWDLAAYEAKESEKILKTASAARPKYRDDIATFVRLRLTPLGQTIEAKDWRSFEEAYQRGIDDSNIYHDKYNKRFVRFRPRTTRRNGSISSLDSFLARVSVPPHGIRMDYVTLGRGGPKVSAIGVGMWQAGGKAWGADVRDVDCRKAMERAVELGINLVDTAEAYGDGHSETVMSRAIRNVGRNNVFVATKVGGWHLHADDVKKACAGSLKRLGVREIDLYQVHWPDPWSQVPLRETMK